MNQSLRLLLRAGAPVGQMSCASKFASTQWSHFLIDSRKQFYDVCDVCDSRSPPYSRTMGSLVLQLSLARWRFRFRLITCRLQREHSTLASPSPVASRAGQLSRMCLDRWTQRAKDLWQAKHTTALPPQHGRFSIPRPAGSAGFTGSGSRQFSLSHPCPLIACILKTSRSISRSSRRQNSPATGGLHSFNRASSSMLPGLRARSWRFSQPSLPQHSVGCTSRQNPSHTLSHGQRLVKPAFTKPVPSTSKMYNIALRYGMGDVLEIQKAAICISIDRSSDPPPLRYPPLLPLRGSRLRGSHMPC